MKKVSMVLCISMWGASLMSEPMLSSSIDEWKTVSSAISDALYDKNVQLKARESVKRSVDALHDFLLYNMHVVVRKSDAQGKENIKELLMRVEEILEKAVSGLQNGDNVSDEDRQREINELTQEVVIRLLPLIALLREDERVEAGSKEFMENVRVELLQNMYTLVVKLRKECTYAIHDDGSKN